MSPVPADNWTTFYGSALAALERADWILQLTVYPAFYDHHAFGIVQAPRHQCTALWRTWHKSTDVAILTNPIALAQERVRRGADLTATITEFTRPIPEHLLTEFRAQLAALTIPACPDENVIGLDGTSYTLKTHAPGFQSANYKWWSGRPTAWRPLMDWFDQTTTALADLLEVPPQQRP